MSDDNYECSICGETGGSWVGYDSCDKWYHLHCVNVTDAIATVDWLCPDCVD